MKKLIGLITALVIIVTTTVYSSAQADINIQAPSAILVEKTTGTVLYEKEADTRMKPASVTKIMTLLLIMEAIESGQISYDDIITASAHATSMGGSQVYLKEGETMTVNEMLKCIVIASANDCCVAMAEFISGSTDAFVAAMNDKALKLKMTNTNFENCTGLDSDNHYTTARDISKMSQELLKHSDIKNYTTIWMDSIRNGEFGLTNTNKLIRFYQNATGLKTGYTSESKYCISATAEKDGMELIAVIMASESSDKRNAEAKTLLEYGFSNYTLYKKSVGILPNIEVIKGKSDFVTPILSSETPLVISKSKIDSITTEIVMPKNVSAPVEQGQKLGSVKYMLDGKVLSETDIISTNFVEKSDIFDIFLDLINYFLFL